MQIVTFLYPGMTALDLIGPHEVLSQLPGATVVRAAETAGPVKTDTDICLTADVSLGDVTQADVLLVPGSSNAWPQVRNEAVLEWIRYLDAHTTWTTSVCTGALILAAAGLLKGRNAVTHWAEMERLPEFGAVPTKARVVEDGKYMTAAGVSAGIDMGLTLAARIAGEDMAKAIQLGIEYDPAPPFNAGSPDTAPKEIKDLVAGVLAAARDA